MAPYSACWEKGENCVIESLTFFAILIFAVDIKLFFILFHLSSTLFTWFWRSSMHFSFVQYIKRWNKMLNLFRNGSSWKSTVEMWFVSGCILPQTIFRYTSENTYGRKVLLHFLYEWSSHKIDLFHLIFSQAIRMWRMFEEIFTEINA